MEGTAPHWQSPKMAKRGVRTVTLAPHHLLYDLGSRGQGTMPMGSPDNNSTKQTMRTICNDVLTKAVIRTVPICAILLGMYFLIVILTH
jgi:hypothetical protein